MGEGEKQRREAGPVSGEKRGVSSIKSKLRFFIGRLLRRVQREKTQERSRSVDEMTCRRRLRGSEQIPIGVYTCVRPQQPWRLRGVGKSAFHALHSRPISEQEWEKVNKRQPNEEADRRGKKTHTHSHTKTTSASAYQVVCLTLSAAGPCSPRSNLSVAGSRTPGRGRRDQDTIPWCTVAGANGRAREKRSTGVS